MRNLLTFGVGLAAMAVSAVARAYAHWLLNQVAGGVATGTSILSDMVRFLQELVRKLAGQLCGWRIPAGEYEDEYADARRGW